MNAGQVRNRAERASLVGERRRRGSGRGELKRVTEKSPLLRCHRVSVVRKAIYASPIALVKRLFSSDKTIFTEPPQFHPVNPPPTPKITKTPIDTGDIYSQNLAQSLHPTRYNLTRASRQLRLARPLANLSRPCRQIDPLRISTRRSTEFNKTLEPTARNITA